MKIHYVSVNPEELRAMEEELAELRRFKEAHSVKFEEWRVASEGLSGFVGKYGEAWPGSEPTQEQKEWLNTGSDFSALDHGISLKCGDILLSYADGKYSRQVEGESIEKTDNPT